MAYQSRSSRIDSWLRGILFALAGVVVGLALIVAMIWLSLWNEIGLLQAQRALLAAAQPPLVVWSIRLLAMAGLIAGCYLVSAPLSAFANIVPGIGAPSCVSAPASCRSLPGPALASSQSPWSGCFTDRGCRY